MLEGLDDVNCGKLRHSYGRAEDITGLLRSLLAAQDEDAQAEAFVDLANHIHHQGDIDSIVAATVPFLIQILQSKTFSKRSWILTLLGNLIISCNTHLKYKSEMSDLRDEYAAFASITRETPALLYLLNDPDDTIRGQATELLTLVRDQHPLVRLTLWRASEQEENPFVRAAMIYGTGTLITNRYRYEVSVQRVCNQYQNLFQELLTSSQDLVVRLAAALAWIESNPIKGTIIRIEAPDVVSHIFGEVLMSTDIDYKSHKFNFLDAILHQSAILEYLHQLNIESIAEALHATNMNAETAHIIIRGMLNITFVRIGKKYQYESDPISAKWSLYEPNKRTKEQQGHIYSFERDNLPYILQPYLEGKTLNQQQNFVISVVVNCDVFWQVPTNLFSFFYGLPDSREALRALLAT